MPAKAAHARSSSPRRARCSPHARARSRRRRAARQMLIDRVFREPVPASSPASSVVLVAFIVCGSPCRRCRRSASTGSDFSPAGSGIRTPSATASSAKSGARSTPRCWRWCSAALFGVAAAIFLSEGYLGQFVYSVLRSMNLHLHPLWAHAARPARASAEEPDRAAGGDSERGLRPVGPLRRHSADPSAVQLAAPEARLDPAVRHRSQRPGHAAGGDRAGDHDPADHHRDQPRRAGVGAVEAARWPPTASARRGGKRSWR